MTLAARIAAALVALAALQPNGGNAADAYPSRTIKVVVPFAAGGATDLITRVVAQSLTESLGVSVIVENRPGGGGTLASRMVAAAEPDGYTLLTATNGPFAIGPAIYQNVGYDPIKSFAPIAYLAGAPDLLVARGDLPVNSLSSLFAYAKAHPGVLNYGAGAGTPANLIIEWLKAKTGSDIVYIPHKGGAPATTDLLGGQTQVGIEILAPLLPYVRDGKLKPLAVTGARRSPELPDVPTLIESGFPGAAFIAAFGIVAPAGTSPAIVAKLNRAINDSLGSDTMKATLAKIGFQSNIGTPEDLAAFIVDEMARWGEVAKVTGVKIE
ncbi:MAG TPA: tripartite tricarboxylate transporter substrate binding protein [Xanthobacteraceae bacterium]|nr:tripartite tricarboxylate transporter substrate binding protein [Xanthobacteraceae bacterium]